MNDKYLFSVPEGKKIKVIIDSDVRNESDDQFAIMHALMTPKFNIRGIIATHFGHDRIKDSMEASWDELQKVLKHAGLMNEVKAVRGSESWIKKEPGFYGKYIPYDNDGVRLIIEEAKACHGEEKLYIGVLGPMTNVASALILAPEIESKLIVVWNGGGLYPDGGPEFNLVNDIAAANYILSSNVEVWQIPTKVYGLPRVSLSEMQYKIYPCGEIGKYLFNQTLEFLELMKEYKDWPRAESLDICDLTVIGLLMEEHRYCYKYIQAPFVGEDMYYRTNSSNRPIRVYEDIDARYILEDFFCKLAINYR
jgi:purine nucleosidase